MRPLEGTSAKEMLLDGRFEPREARAHESLIHTLRFCLLAKLENQKGFRPLGSKSPLATADGRIKDSSAAPWSEIHIIAPTPGACAICATKHNSQTPHDKESLYYVNQFYRKNGRFPSWEDAMSHCTEDVKAEYRAKLKRRPPYAGDE